MVVGSERNASQVAIGIIGNISRNRIDRHRLEDSLHGLLSIHRNSGGSFRAHLSTCGVLPFLELIAEVLGGLQCHHRTFFILFQVGIARNRTGLCRLYRSAQHIFRYLSSSTDQCSLDDDIRQTHRFLVIHGKE